MVYQYISLANPAKPKCPSCGGDELLMTAPINPADNGVSIFIECPECGFLDRMDSDMGGIFDIAAFALYFPSLPAKKRKSI